MKKLVCVAVVFAMMTTAASAAIDMVAVDMTGQVATDFGVALNGDGTITLGDDAILDDAGFTLSGDYKIWDLVAVVADPAGDATVTGDWTQTHLNLVLNQGKLFDYTQNIDPTENWEFDPNLEPLILDRTANTRVFTPWVRDSALIDEPYIEAATTTDGGLVPDSGSIFDPLRVEPQIGNTTPDASGPAYFRAEWFDIVGTAGTKGGAKLDRTGVDLWNLPVDYELRRVSDPGGPNEKVGFATARVALSADANGTIDGSVYEGVADPAAGVAKANPFSGPDWVITNGDIVGFAAGPGPGVIGDLKEPLDGVVDFDDLGVLLANWSPPNVPDGTLGDLKQPFDGVVNFDDLGVLLANWTVPGPLQAVPEPSTLALLIAGFLGGIGLLRRRFN